MKSVNCWVIRKRFLNFKNEGMGMQVSKEIEYKVYGRIYTCSYRVIVVHESDWDWWMCFVNTTYLKNKNLSAIADNRVLIRKPRYDWIDDIMNALSEKGVNVYWKQEWVERNSYDANLIFIFLHLIWVWGCLAELTWGL